MSLLIWPPHCLIMLLWPHNGDTDAYGVYWNASWDPPCKSEKIFDGFRRHNVLKKLKKAVEKEETAAAKKAPPPPLQIVDHNAY